jgi:hypothetical protein
MVDDFAAQCERDALVIQDRELPGEQSPTHQRYVDSYSLHRMHLRVDAMALTFGISRRDECILQTVATFAFAQLGDRLSDTARDRVLSKARNNAKRAVHLTREYGSWLRSLSGAKLLILEGASYGGSRAILTNAARQEGLAVVEPQHGWIGTAHAAYNVGRAMFSDDLRQYLPDALLTFGEFWGEGLRTPAQICIVGKPHLNLLSAAAPALGRRRLTVLFISSMYRREELAHFVLRARAVLPDAWTVLVRLHPSERGTELQYFENLCDVEGVDFDPELDVYSSLSNTRIVIGHSSTVLYEALAFGCAVIPISSPLKEDYVRNPGFESAIHNEEGLRNALNRIAIEGPVRLDRGGVLSTWADFPASDIVATMRPFLSTAG